MGVIDVLNLLAAIVGLTACVCRLDALRVGRHATAVILLHAAMGVLCIFAAYHAWLGITDAMDVAAVVGTLAWIVMSLPAWNDGRVPKEFETGPAPLDEAQR